jgi:hypothetical protein
LHEAIEEEYIASRNGRQTTEKEVLAVYRMSFLLIAPARLQMCVITLFDDLGLTEISLGGK